MSLYTGPKYTKQLHDLNSEETQPKNSTLLITIDNTTQKDQQ